jgi:ATP-binding cassette subfamily B protein
MSTAELPLDETETSAASEPPVAALPAWRVIVEMVRFRPWYWLIDLLAVILYRSAWQLAPGLILRAFFDQLTGEAPLTLSIWAILALVFSTYLSRMIGGFGFYYADIPLFNELNLMLRTNLMKHILKRPGAAPLPDSAGEAVSRFRDDVFEIPLFTIWINDILTGLAVMVISILMMFAISVPVTLLSLIPVVLIGLIANAASGRIGKYRQASRESTSQVTGFIGEFFGAVQAVKVAAVEEGVLGRFNQLNDRRKKYALRERLFDEVLESIWRNTASLGTGAVLIFSGNAMRNGTFTIGDFSLFVFLLTSLGDLTTFVGMIVARYKKLGVSIQRMYRLMEGAPLGALVEWVDARLSKPSRTGTGVESQPPSASASPVPLRLETCEVRELSYHFPRSENGIADASFQLARGTLTVVTGRVGSGKTTLLRTVLGLLPKDSGEVRWNGETITNPAEFFIPPQAAYTAQVPRLFSDTLRANLLLGLEKSDQELLEAVRLAVFERDLAEMEGGLDTLVGPRGVRLSGGQLQRAAAARMFLRHPELLVFDDLSSALDVETERQLWERLFAREDTTCLVVSHRKPVLKRADQILVMREGRIVAQGQYEELMECCEEMRELVSENGKG